MPQKERRHRKIDPVELIAYSKKNPDSYLSEAAEVFNCSAVAIHKARKRLNITRKKTKLYMERCEEKRAYFRNLINSLPKDRLYYIDECGIDTYVHREYAYASRGKEVSGKKYKRTNIVAAKCGDKIVETMIYDCTTDAILFEHWFEHALLKTIPHGSYCILDNAAFHRKNKLHALAEQAGCTVIFLHSKVLFDAGVLENCKPQWTVLGLIDYKWL